MEDSQAILSRFNRLMRDIQDGEVTRTCFRAWEIDLLLDIQACDLSFMNKRRVFQRYAKAVRKRLEQGSPHPLKLSEYLARGRSRSRIAGAA